MRRLVLGCLLGLGASACGGTDEPTDPTPPVVVEPQEEPLCPDSVVPERREGGAALSSDPSAAAEPVLVRFRPGTVRSAALSREREGRVEALGGRIKYNWAASGSMAVSLTPEAQARLALDPDVQFIEPDKEVFALGMPSLVPPALLAATPYGEYTRALRMTQANQVWDPSDSGALAAGAPTGRGITVCVIDSGIDPRHPEFTGLYAGGYDFVDGDENPSDQDAKGAWGGGHGTHVAGTVAAQIGSAGNINPHDKTLSAGGMVGVAPQARLLVARVLNTRGSGRVADVIAAVRWCKTKGAQIATLSLGSSSYSEEESEAFKEVWADGKGMLTLAASGNAGTTAPPEEKVYPAAYDHVIAVGAVDDDGKHADFSQGGPHLSLVAPGVNVYSTFVLGRATYSRLNVNDAELESNVLEYAPVKNYEGTLVDCGLGKGLRSCTAGSSCAGFVAYVDRGEINFSEKVRNVASQGARAVIVGNSKPEEDKTLAFTLGGDANWPPVVAVPTTLVSKVKGQLGSKVRVGVEGADYAFLTGTSMATPHVAGVAALVWSARPSLTPAEVRKYLEKTALPLEGQKGVVPHRDYGFGLVQAKAAVDAVRADAPR